MAFEVKKTTKVAGVANVKVLAINPTVKEAEKIGIQLQEDTKWDKEKPRLDIYLQIVDKGFECKHKMAIFIKDKLTGQDGTYESFIDETGANGSKEYLKGNDIRAAREGETQLASLLIAWTNGANIGKTELDKIYNGNLSDLKQLVLDASTNTFKVVLGIRFVEKDGNINAYMDTYPYKVAKAGYGKFREKVAELAVKNADKAWFKDRWFPADFNITLYTGQTLADKVSGITPDDDLFGPATEEEAAF